MLVDLLGVIFKGGPLEVMQRGWTQEEDYRTLAARLLGKGLGNPTGLSCPSMVPGWEHPRALPGDLVPEDDAELCAMVCKRTQGSMTPEVWETLDEQQRMGWLRSALTEEANG
jgi:hypothetical protein